MTKSALYFFFFLCCWEDSFASSYNGAHVNYDLAGQTSAIDDDARNGVSGPLTISRDPFEELKASAKAWQNPARNEASDDYSFEAEKFMATVEQCHQALETCWEVAFNNFSPQHENAFFEQVKSHAWMEDLLALAEASQNLASCFCKTEVPALLEEHTKQKDLPEFNENDDGFSSLLDVLNACCRGLDQFLLTFTEAGSKTFSNFTALSRLNKILYYLHLWDERFALLLQENANSHSSEMFLLSREIHEMCLKMLPLHHLWVNLELQEALIKLHQLLSQSLTQTFPADQGNLTFSLRDLLFSPQVGETGLPITTPSGALVGTTDSLYNVLAEICANIQHLLDGWFRFPSKQNAHQ